MDTVVEASGSEPCYQSGLARFWPSKYWSVEACFAGGLEPQDALVGVGTLCRRRRRHTQAVADKEPVEQCQFLLATVVVTRAFPKGASLHDICPTHSS